ncbi:MAG: hypothetical protein DRP18_02185 [Candidatus Aenigmatarchaeota archaeon]|nr:MAG: hypothetical protein DRP18_02185 [Candidatus Aenigmarchaeota archaeon]
MKKGIALISAIILIGITIVAVGIIYNSAVPIVKKLQISGETEKMKQVFNKLDEIVIDVASGGKGTRRTVYLTMGLGRLWLNSSDNSLYWKTETSAKVVSPRTQQKTGNLIFGSNLETYANETQYNGTDAYVLENEHLRVYIRKIGSPQNPEHYKTSDLLLSVYNKDIRKSLDLDGLEISIDSNPLSVSGQGYTVLSEKGKNLPYATVTAYMSSGYIDYYINFTLESGEDFIIIRGGLT